MERKNGKSIAVEEAEGKGHMHQKELMGKERGCGEEDGKSRAVEGAEKKVHRR